MLLLEGECTNVVEGKGLTLEGEIVRNSSEFKSHIDYKDKDP